MQMGGLICVENVPPKEYNIRVCYSAYLEEKMDYITTSEMAKKWSISRRRVTMLCQEGRIEGAILRGNTWLIPEDAKKPEDPRKAKRK